MTNKITRTGSHASTRPAAPEGINAADQANIMKMIASEMKKGGDEFSTGRGTKLTPKYMVHPPGPGGGGMVAKYMVVRPDPGGGGPVAKYMVVRPDPGGGGMVAKYMVVRPGPGGGGAVAKYMVRPPEGGGGGIVAKYMVRPPEGGGGGIVAKYMVRPPEGGGGGIVAKYMVVRPPIGPGGGIVAKYMVVPPGIVPMYIAPAPWAGVDAHQAVINKVTADGKITKKEAQLVRKLFNRDIHEAGKEGRDIHTKVASYLHKVLDGLHLDKTSKNLIFGAGGPGFTKPIITPKYMVVRPE